MKQINTEMMESKEKLLPHKIKSFKTYLANRKVPVKLIFIITGVLSTIWFLIRVIPKPSRATYPCMRAAAPVMSAFVIYIIGMATTVVAFKKMKKLVIKANYLGALGVFILAIGIVGFTMTQNAKSSKAGTVNLTEQKANDPIGVAKGIHPGRVVWVHDPDATNENCSQSFSDAWFMDKNNDQDAIDNMLTAAVRKLTEEETTKEAWDAIFRFHNGTRGKGNVSYQEGEIIFIKINRTSSWGGNFDTGDLSRRENNNFGISETSPHLVLTVLKHLVNEVGVAENDIYVGDPLKHIYKHDYEKWHGAFPDVHYLDNSYSNLGREKVVKSSTALIEYSDKGDVLRSGSWSSALDGDPIYEDHFYTIFEDMEYMINIPTLKAHARAGITMFAKNHFGSHTRGDAKHLHGGLIYMGDSDPTREGYGMYRVQVDIMGHELTGKKNLVYLMDALYTSDHEVNQPDKWRMAPFNNDWTSSIFMSLDPVAIESVGYDFLHEEFDGTNGLDDFPQWIGVDDYLEQAADKSKWPAGITYDPENDGTELESLGVHEHWNNADDKQYSRNLETGNGIELLKVDPNNVVISVQEEETFAMNMTIYPNPVRDHLNLRMENDYTGTLSVEIYDVTGRMFDAFTIQKHNRLLKKTLSLESLPNNMYVLRINDGKQTKALMFDKTK